mmetsp:Transcript_28988/g.91515  ORF Transcript_28988/g.91515 Transcript_28988/m.91515 type:complete len:213 (+) Transcript_28988:1447-2085(+)
MVHQRGVLLTGGWHPPLRCSLHGALLHHVLHMAAPVLLPVWLPDAGDHHFGHHLCGDFDHADVLPADKRGLQLVVAVLLRKRLVGHVRLHVLLPLLFHAHADWPLCWRHALLRVHVRDLLHVRPPHRLHRLQCHLPLCPLDLRFDQDRLTSGGRRVARPSERDAGMRVCGGPRARARACVRACVHVYVALSLCSMDLQGGCAQTQRWPWPRE